MRENLDVEMREVPPQPANNELFIELVTKVSQKCVISGFKTQCIYSKPNERHQSLPEAVRERSYPFAEDMVEAGEDLMLSVTEDRTRKWRSLMENLYMKTNSRRAWKLHKNLSGESKRTKESFTELTADKVAILVIKEWR